MTGNKKINWLLILQGWAMLWVVIGHSFLGDFEQGPEWENVLCEFAYSFHMPLFILVSGWLFHLTRLKTYVLKPEYGWHFSVNGERITGSIKWTYWTVVRDKVLRLLLPGFVFSIVAFTLKLVFPGEMSRQTGLNIREIVHAYLYPYDNPMRELWFIVTLFLLMMLTPLWKWLLSKEWIMWSGLVILTLLHFGHPAIEFLCVGKVFSYAIWFYLGLVISKEKIVDRFLVKQPWLTLFTGIALFIAGKYTYPFIATVGGITLSLGLALILDEYSPKIFFTFRNYTYQIFLMGIFAQMFVKIMYRHISMSYVAAYILCILMGLYVPVLVSKMIEKINWKPLSLCVGLNQIKKYK